MVDGKNKKDEEIRNHRFSNINPSYFMGHTVDVSWFSNRKLKLDFRVF